MVMVWSRPLREPWEGWLFGWQEQVARLATGASLVLLCSLFFLTFALNAEAFSQEKSGQPATVSLGLSQAKPGDVVDIPLTLSGPKEIKIGSIAAEITFLKNGLTFINAEPGLAGEGSGANVQATAKEASEGSALSVVEVMVSAKQPLKFGILAYLKFRVSKDAKKGPIPLNLKSSQATSVEDAPLQVAKGKDGQVIVFNADEEIPVMGCFFFTH